MSRRPRRKRSGLARCRECRRAVGKDFLNARGFCALPRCQTASNRLIAKAFRSSERIPIVPTPRPAPRDLPPPRNETPSLVSRLTPEQQRRLSAVARSRMTTSEGLSPE